MLARERLLPIDGPREEKVVVMDDWRFNSRVLPLSLQLLWFEGKPMPVVRPQGKDEFSGHVLYRGSAPIFATTPLKHIEDMERAVRHAEADGTGSEWSMLLRRLKIYRYSVRIPKPSKHIENAILVLHSFSSKQRLSGRCAGLSCRPGMVDAWVLARVLRTPTERPKNLSLVNYSQVCVWNKEADFSCAKHRCMESVPSAVVVQTHVSCVMRHTERSTQSMQRACQSVSDMWSVCRVAAFGQHPTPGLGDS